MSGGGIHGPSRIWQGPVVHVPDQPQPRQTRARSLFGSFLAKFKLLRRPVSQSGIVAPPLQGKDRQKELQQSYLHALSQPDCDLGATMIALADLADRLTDKKANIHNLGKAQQRLTEYQLRRLAKNFRSFRQLGQYVEIVISRVLMDGVTTKAEKRFLAFLRTIAANIKATGDMIQSLSAEKGFNADLTACLARNPVPVERAFLVAWEQVKNESDRSSSALIRDAIDQSLLPTSVGASRESVRRVWKTFKERGAFDSAATVTSLEAALRSLGDDPASCRETASQVATVIGNLRIPSQQEGLLRPLLTATANQLDGKSGAKESLAAAVRSVLGRSPKLPVFGEDFEEEDTPYREESDGEIRQTATDRSTVNRLVPDEPEISTPVRFLWEEVDPDRMRYAIHDLSRKLRDRHRSVSDNPDRWMRHVKRDLVRQGLIPARAKAILDVIDREDFGALKGHSGLVVSLFRQIAGESEVESAVKIQNDADVFEKILVKTLNWNIAEKAADPDFHPYDEIERMLKGSGFESINVQIYSFFERHRWLGECLAIPDDEDEALTWRRADVTKMKEVKRRLGDLAEDLETVSNSLWVISRELIGIDLPVTPLDTDEQIDRLLQIYRSYAESRKAGDPELTPVQALGIYFDQYGRGTESLVEQAAQLPRLAGQPATMRPHAGSEWQSHAEDVDALATRMGELPRTPR